jgi:hypothetical protein
MNKEKSLRKMLYAGAGLVILTIILIPAVIVPFLIFDKTGTSTPGPASIGTTVVILLHLLILYGFREAIIESRRNGHLNVSVYIICGIGLLLLALLLSDMATEFLSFYHYYLAAGALFLAIACNFFAAIIAFTAIFLQPGKSVNN